MNDDLHDIDRLFRDGIEGHEENVPSSVWEAVNNDLDKKQASYYKSKYDRLKRAAALLLLLCVLGGVYIIYENSLHKKGQAVAQKTTAPASSGAPSTNLNVSVPDSSDNLNSNATASNNTTIDAVDSSEKNGGNTTVTRKDNASKSINRKTEAHNPVNVSNTVSGNRELKQEWLRNMVAGKEKSPMKQGPKPMTDETSSRYPAKSTGIQKTKESKTGSALIASSNNRKQASGNRSNNVSASSSLPLRGVEPLTAKNYEPPFINLNALSANNRSILPQTTTTAKNKIKTIHGVSLSAFAAPNLSFDRLEDNDHLAGPGRNRNEAHREEQSNASFSGGLLLNYELTKKWSFQSGVTVTSSSTSIAPKTVYAKPDNNGHNRYELHCSSGYVYISPKSGAQPAVGDSAKTGGTTSKLTYVTIPASLGYRINAGRFSLSPSVGAGVNILTSGKATTSLSNAVGNESTTTAISGLKSTYVDGHIGIGIEYGLSKKLAVGIRPNARIALTPINKETPVQSYQNYLSIETGVRIKF